VLISAHDYHNKNGAPGNTSVTAATPAWSHAWSSQSNVSPSIVTKTGGTYAVKAPVEAEDKPKTRKTTKK